MLDHTAGLYTAISMYIVSSINAINALSMMQQELQILSESNLNPAPYTVQVCECVVILRNLKDVSWAGAKSMMADTGFLKGLVEFDKDSLSDKQVTMTFAQKITITKSGASTSWHPACKCVACSSTEYHTVRSLMYQSISVGCSNSAKGSDDANAHSACKREVDVDAGEEGARVHEGS